MSRACINCEWGRSTADENSPPEPTDLVLTCREGPTPVRVNARHWCGRFRIAERLAGGHDVRTKA